VSKAFTWEHGPFEDCWRCREKGTFGVLSIGGDSVTKRCTNCRYSHSEELPKLDKKVIYLDQFAFSELHKLRAGTRREDKWSDFWSEVDTLLNRAVLLQQVVLPHSNIHHQETIVSPFAGALKETQEAIGGDIAFVNTDEIQLRQVEEYVRAYFVGDEPKIVFNIDDVLQGKRNDWLPDMRISAGMDWSRFAPEMRDRRANTHAEIASLIEGWRQSEFGFDQVIERELGAYFESRQQALLQTLLRFEEGVAQDDIWAGINMAHSFVIREIDIIRHYATKAGVEEHGLTSAIAEFWSWPKNREQPYGRILSYLFAALAAQFRGGRAKLPSPGFLNDITAISAYIPYVDAMFIDNECAELLRHGRCRKDLCYRAKIFSLNDANVFLGFIREIVDGTPDEVRREATALYGLN
jgi:hypothetical protein